MKVSELENGLFFGDVIIQKVSANLFNGAPLGNPEFYEFLVTWIRQEEQDGPRNESDPKDYDVTLMASSGEIVHITDVRSLDDWEYSHSAYNFGFKTEI